MSRIRGKNSKPEMLVRRIAATEGVTLAGASESPNSNAIGRDAGEVAGGVVGIYRNVDADGATFPGFDTDATWILALRCGRCANPAPPVLTVITPR